MWILRQGAHLCPLVVSVKTDLASQLGCVGKGEIEGGSVCAVLVVK